MAPQQKLEKAAWKWAEEINTQNVTQQHLEMAYRVKLQPCQRGKCRRNCKGNPNCLFGLGEKEWLDAVKEDNWFAIDDPQQEKRSPNCFVGLKNLGATCYVNCLLQLWFHNPVLRKGLYQWKPEDDPQEKNNLLKDGFYSPTSCAGHLQLIFGLLQYSDRRYIDPSDFVNSLGLDTAQQQDAQEFSKLFMNLLETKLQYQKNLSVREILQSQFRGEYNYDTICTNCKQNSTCPSKFYELDLNITGHKDLQECIEEFLQEEKLEGADQYFCSHCQSKQNAVRKIELIKMPPVLNLQLLRFIFDRKSGQKKKLNSYINFPEVLNVDKYVSTIDLSQTTYDLSAVLIHRGPTAFSGHYIAHIKDRATGDWYKFNDETVEKMKGSLKLGGDEEEIGKQPKRPKVGKGHHSSRNAYMLVYRLRSKEIQAIPADGSDEWDLPERVQDLVIQDNSKFEEWIKDLERMRKLNIEKGKARQEEVRNLYNLMPVTNGKFEWLQTEWLIHYLTSEEDIKPVDNLSFLCPHSKLNVDNICQLKIISQEAADAIFAKYGGGPRLKDDALCHHCVVSRCRLIRIRAQINNDYKFINNLLKEKMNPNEEGYWMGKASQRSWRKLALIRFENANKENGTSHSNHEEQALNAEVDTDDQGETTLPLSFTFNEDILCDHNDLSIHEADRRLVPVEVWKRLKQYFRDAPEFSQSHPPCGNCEVVQEQNDQLRETYRGTALVQKTALNDLYLDKNRPITAKAACGTALYAVNADFVDKWRKFLRDPGRREPPHGVDNGQLFCSHSRLRFLPEVELNSGASRIILVWPNEWASIRSFYSVDSDVTVTCQCLGSSTVHPTFVSTPETCGSCYTIVSKKEEEEKVEFGNGKIFIRKVNTVEDVSDVEEGDGLFPQASLAAKRKKLEHPAPCETSSLGQVRRSTRNRRIRGEHEFIITSNQTLRDLKLQIMKAFSVAPFDQHLSLDGRPLTDNASTLSALHVVPGSRILLKADEPLGQIIMEEDYAKDTQPEEGFKGTELLRS